MVSDASLRATHDYTHPVMQPGKLDVLFVPGPEPDATWDEAALGFLKRHAKTEGTDILSICTGWLICAASKISEGKTLCGRRGMEDELKKCFPGTTFTGDEYRWVQDGDLWPSGGITNGNNLVAAYVRASEHFPGPIAEIACKMAEVGDRPQLHTQSQTSFTIGFAWQPFKALFTSAK